MKYSEQIKEIHSDSPDEIRNNSQICSRAEIGNRTEIRSRVDM